VSRFSLLNKGMTMSERDDDGATAAPRTTGFAPAPLSTRLMSGSVAVRNYKGSWVGDDSDVVLPDHVNAFSDIDMTLWAVACLNATDALFAPDMAAAIAALDPERAASLAGRKQQLANVIAATLIPVLVVPGEVPAVEPARALFRESLLECLGAAYVSAAGDDGPLLAYPPPPVIRDVRAVTAQSPLSIAEALLWDCAVTVAAPRSTQDELLLALMLNEPSVRPLDAAIEAAIAEPPIRSAPATLFEALARMTFEHPQIAPHLAEVLPGGDEKVARAALERLDALIGDVVLTWSNWFGRALPTTPDVGQASGADQVSWTYRIDFGRPPALRVTRFPVGDHLLPPWPEIAGFATPGEDGQAADLYQASTNSVGGAPLTFTWTGLPILQAQRVDVAASVRRNDNLVPPGSPDGTVTDPAFIYRTPTVLGAAPAGPFADLPSQVLKTGEDAASLSEAIDDLLAPLLALSSLAGLAICDIEIAIEASYTVSWGAEDAQIDSGSPIFLTHNSLALSPNPLDVSVSSAAFRRSVVDALVAWHAAMQPDDTRAAIRFAITLSAAGEKGRSPLVYLGQVEVAVPATRADWWQ